MELVGVFEPLDGRHPASWYGRCAGTVYFEDVEIGRPYWGTELVADEQEMLAYGQRFDPWPMHADPDVGDASPLGGLVASGGYTAVAS